MNTFATKDGATLMLAAPTIAIDQPLKIVVREDANGKVWLTYNVPTTFNSARIPGALAQQEMCVIPSFPDHFARPYVSTSCQSCRPFHAKMCRGAKPHLAYAPVASAGDRYGRRELG